MSAAPRVVLFDVMDTLVRDPFPEVISGFFGMTLEQLLQAKHPSAWVEFERGERTHASFMGNFFADGRPFDHAAFERAVCGAYEWIPGMEGILAALASQPVSCVALSNYPEWYRWIEARLGLGRYLDWRFVSCRTGVRKPDVAAYTGAAAALGLDPARCLFVDDRQSNVDAAHAAGMDAVRFVDADTLAAELRSRGLAAALPHSSQASS